MTIEELNKRGEEVFAEYTTGTKKHLTTAINGIAPDVSTYITEFVFGSIYAREGLTQKEKVNSTISALIAMGGCENELNTHFNTALNVGFTPEEILEICIHLLPYAGFPRVINAIKVAEQVLITRGIDFTPVSQTKR